MSGFIRESKFRNIVPSVDNRQTWYEQLKIADASTSDSNGVTSTSRFLAYPDGAGGEGMGRF